jgi:hypothetical protein
MTMHTIKRALLALSVTFVSTRARAAGIEDTIGGTVGLGRAANYGRVNDFMATWQNPANLAVVPGSDLGFEFRVPLLNACYQRFVDPNGEYKQPDAYEGFEGTEIVGRMCNEGTPGLTANTGWAQSFDSGWGYGIGLFTPAGVGGAKYGNDTIVSWYPSENETYQVTSTGAESPTRQMGIERDAVTAFVMAGLGYTPIRALRFGASAGWGFASVYNKSVVSVLGGTFRDQEVLNEIRATDWALARANASVVLSPFDQLDLFGVVTYQSGINASGSAVLTANGIHGAPLKSCSDPTPGTHCRIDGVQLNVPFPTLEATFGSRLVIPRNKRQRVLDPMKDELFDLEVDVAWTQTSAVDSFDVKLHDKLVEDPDVPRIQFANAEDATTSYPRQSTTIPKNWKDTWTVRVGGDIQAIPERMTLRAGVSYATRAVPVETMNIDYWPVEKLGIHVGATFAFLERFKVHLAYAHLFYQATEVAVGTGQVRDIASIDEAKSKGVNEGRFEAALDVFSLQLNASF